MRKFPKNLLLGGIIIFLLALVGASYQKYQNQKFEAPRQNTPNIDFTISKEMTLDAVISDLYYYDFIKDKKAFLYALEKTNDRNPGNVDAIFVSENKTISTDAHFRISQSMTAWEIADVLLNKGSYTSCDHGCSDYKFIPELLPGGDLAPTIQERYSWVSSYEDCVEAIGHDGGQLTSDQYYERTGIRGCNTPDGRFFLEGVEGESKPIL